MDVLTKIKEKIGYDSFNKGKSYYKSYVRYVSNNHINRGKLYHFKVESETNYYDYYDVSIIEKDDEIVSMYCDCPQFNRAGTCKHIGACLFHYKDLIFSNYRADASIYITNKILSKFDKPKNVLKIKKQLSLEIEIEIIDNPYYYYSSSSDPFIKYKLKIGVDKLYSLNNKISNFIDCYNNRNKTLEFGKNFIYDSNIHYFNEDDERIINEFINLYQRLPYHNNDVTTTLRNSKLLFDAIKNKNISVNNYGTFNGIKEENPIIMNLVKEKDEYKLKIVDDKDIIKLSSNYEFIIKNNNFYHVTGDSLSLLSMMANENIEELIFKENNLNKFEKNILPIVKNNVSLSDELKEKIIIGKDPTPKIYIDYLNGMIDANVKFDYGNNEISYFDDVNDIIRDTEFENNVIEDLLKLNFEIIDNKLLIIDLDYIVDFINNSLEELGKKYEVFTTNKLRETKILKETNIRSNFSIGQDNILKYSFELGGINKNEIGDVLESLRNRKKYFKLKNGNIIKLEDNDNLEEFDRLLNNMDFTKNDIEENGIIPKYRAIYIDSLKSNIINCNNLFTELVENFKKYKDSNIQLTESDLKLLRDYQLTGIKWLYNIYKCGFGGILADEMGLGKSIQLIYLIKQIIKEKKDAKILIVSPTSLVYNWENEFKKFGSELKYKVMADNKSKRKEDFKHLDDVNIIITTYGLIREDKEEYENINFELIAIDEAQNIKNPSALMTKEIKKLNANTKIALTGTPLENSVLELWSIFDFIMPGYLANIKRFSEKYNVKDVDNDSLKKLEILNRQINPFILRRKKSDVIKELPPKIENSIYIDLYPEQKKVYVAQLEKTRKDIEDTINTEGFSKARFKILQLLTKLRQICIDPKIVYENYNGGSSKIDNLVKTVREIVDNNHKILLFTNYLTALNIVNRELNNNGITSYIIDGSVPSKKRMELVDKFNNDDTNVFLITLKAGGTGLNLTSADVVIHLDLWWNPQVENQATDRAHRIGQTKTVEVIKMVCKGTIEERILELQEKKKILSDSLIEGEDIDKNIISKLTEKDIKRLLTIDNQD